MNKLLTILLILIPILLFVATSCEPAEPIEIRNQTNESLIVFINSNKIGTVEPQAMWQNKLYWGNSKFIIEAKNLKGEIVYSKTFTREQMYAINWAITIQPKS